MYLAMSPTDVLDSVIRLNPSAKTVVDVGAYYCGWSKYMADQLPSATIYAVQTPDPHKLNHIIDTEEGELSEFDILGWKKHMKGMLATEYHQYYDFNLFAKEVNTRTNITGILATSPNWNTNYDICLISMTKDPNENFKQYVHWRKFGNKGSVLCIAAYSELEGDEFVGPLQGRSDFVDAVKKIDPNIIEYDHEHLLLHNL
tara:strand:- start:378 stop:980 length:603 start_codon:yes stop_codon:yes gene_type:complete